MFPNYEPMHPVEWLGVIALLLVIVLTVIASAIG